VVADFLKSLFRNNRYLCHKSLLRSKFLFSLALFNSSPLLNKWLSSDNSSLLFMSNRSKPYGLYNPSFGKGLLSDRCSQSFGKESLSDSEFRLSLFVRDQ
jgi:hypothetical protein